MDVSVKDLPGSPKSRAPSCPTTDDIAVRKTFMEDKVSVRPAKSHERLFHLIESWTEIICGTTSSARPAFRGIMRAFGGKLWGRF